jgi:hypothetical protein
MTTPQPEREPIRVVIVQRKVGPWLIIGVVVAVAILLLLIAFPIFA